MFRAGYAVLCYSVQGPGFTAELHASSVIALLDHLNLDNVTIAMHDWAGVCGVDSADFAFHPVHVQHCFAMNMNPVHVQHSACAIFMLCRLSCTRWGCWHVIASGCISTGKAGNRKYSSNSDLLE